MKGQSPYSLRPEQQAALPEPQLAHHGAHHHGAHHEARHGSQHSSAQRRPTPISRATLALLDEYTAQYSRQGYDPYNTQQSRGTSDAWVRKPKRD